MGKVGKEGGVEEGELCLSLALSWELTMELLEEREEERMGMVRMGEKIEGRAEMGPKRSLVKQQDWLMLSVKTMAGMDWDWMEKQEVHLSP